MSKPVIYLDVDGVLNALGSQEHAVGHHAWGDFKLYPKVKPDSEPINHPGYDLRLSKSMVAAIAALPVDVMWLTTWRYDAVKHVAPLVDAPDWPVIHWRGEKGAYLREDQAGNPRPYIWIDDFEATEANNFFWMKDLLDASKVPYLLIKPDSLQGITRDDVNEIREFIDWLQSLSFEG